MLLQMYNDFIQIIIQICVEKDYLILFSPARLLILKTYLLIVY